MTLFYVIFFFVQLLRAYFFHYYQKQLMPIFAGLILNRLDCFQNYCSLIYYTYNNI